MSRTGEGFARAQVAHDARPAPSGGATYVRLVDAGDRVDVARLKETT